MLWWNLQLLKCADYRIRRRAIKSLGKSQGARVLAVLTERLSDDHYLVRKEAARALGEIGGAEVIKSLINLSEISLQCAMAKVAVGSLQNVLDRTSTEAASEDLQDAATLDDVSGFYQRPLVGMAHFTESRRTIRWTVDCSRIREIASRELVRRGVAV
ncbi:MAG TPA: HEAT repeat domain-containing protein [Blastocatellia bacterium]|nr:HEAT repeat domain-containing protein [Blastocatellia bacterium]